MSATLRTVEEAKEEGTKEGFFIVQSTPTSILLDLDTAEALELYEEQLPRIQLYMEITELERWHSKSKNWHVLLTLKKPMEFHKRIALQACLGSDLKKELISIINAALGQVEPSLLFKPTLTYRS
jgi:hypothetical protein